MHEVKRAIRNEMQNGHLRDLGEYGGNVKRTLCDVHNPLNKHELLPPMNPKDYVRYVIDEVLRLSEGTRLVLIKSTIVEAK